MDTPICITDAVTLIDHIHQIKSWTYHGHLRLIVPSSTSETLEQLYQKSIEAKPASKEQPRPRSSLASRSAKKEYPVFDINPRLAREYLSRVKDGKDQQTGHQGRPIYDKDESHTAVHFQQANEQYTPWKDIEVVEEEAPLVEERPTTWAEALRKKQNLANGISEKNHLPKGPIKPKLVAKAVGGDGSPWKIQKNAPSVSAKEVPGSLRPFMSCALWRIHESIDRNDTNQLFVLTDHQHIRDIAQKLKLNVRSTQELAGYISSRVEPIDLNVFGDLERDFGAQVPSKAASVNGPATQKQEHATKHDAIRIEAKGTENGIEGNHAATRDEEREKFGGARSDLDAMVNPGATPERKTVPGNISSEKEVLWPAGEDGPARMMFGNGHEKNLHEEGNLIRSAAPPVDESSKGVEVNIQPVRNPWNKVESPKPAESSNVSDPTPHEAFRTLNVSRTKTPTGSSAESSVETLATPPQNANPQATQSVDRYPGVKSDGHPSRDFIPAKKATEALTPPKIQDLSELEDSDEEIVVFKPKRASAQGKLGQQTSRPSTANAEHQANVPALSPQQAVLSSKMPPQHASKRLSGGISHAHPPQSNGPTVIDPDVFGRGFAVNTNPTPRGGYHGMRARHSPRSSVQNAPTSNSRPTSSHHHPRLSPPRHSPGVSPRPQSRVLEQPKDHDASDRPFQPIQAPIGSHYSAPNVHEQRQEQFAKRQPILAPIGSHLPSPRASQPKANSPRNSRAYGQLDPDFVRNSRSRPLPRRNTPPHARGLDDQTLDPTAQHVLASNPYASHANGTGMANPRAPAPRISKPTLFEPMVDDTRAPSPQQSRANAGDVQYILKSGTTREAARGKGKLWVG